VPDQPRPAASGYQSTPMATAVASSSTARATLYRVTLTAY